MSVRYSLWLTALVATACSSKVTSTIDSDLQARVETVTTCFPDLYQRLDALLEITDSWRLNTSTTPADPTGLTWAEQNDGTVDVTYIVSGVTIAMTVGFYSPTGTLQDFDLSAATTLGEAVAIAATELRNLYGTTGQFLVGDWTLSGSGVTGAGAFTGILGGSGSQDELLELRTTTATPAGGPPPNADATISEASTSCSLTFNTQSLQLDTDPAQSYPIGTVDITVVGQRTVSGSVTFDGTSTAVIAIDGINGTFAFDIVARSVAYHQ